LKQYVIFGTGSVAKKAWDMICQYPDLQIAYFLDNFPKSEYFEGIEVVKGDIFLKRDDKMDYQYYVASVYRPEITEQLLAAGIPQDAIINAVDIFLEQAEFVDKQMNYHGFKPIETMQEKALCVFDFSSGFVLGGVENWSYNLAACLKEHNKKIRLLSNACEEEPPEKFSSLAIKSQVTSFWDYKISSIQQLLSEVERLLPCTVFIAHISDLLLACLLLKDKYKEMIKIVSVVHGGMRHLVTENQRILKYVDYVLPVSYDIYRALLQCAGQYSSKVVFKETPVHISDTETRTYSLNADQPIRIAYASRLEKIHKHSELLLPLLDALEQRGISYQLDVAGNGELFDKIEKYVMEHSLGDKVHLLGQIHFSKMEEFWLSHDVAINLSECEGCSMAMLESMSAGTVPVFTDVSSTRHFIKHGENGFIVDYQDIDAMAEVIEYLDYHRDLLRKLGKRAHEVIEEKCKMEDYIQFILHNVWIRS